MFQEYFKIHKSSEIVRPKLTAKSIQHLSDRWKMAGMLEPQ